MQFVLLLRLPLAKYKYAQHTARITYNLQNKLCFIAEKCGLDFIEAGWKTLLFFSPVEICTNWFRVHGCSYGGSIYFEIE